MSENDASQIPLILVADTNLFFECLRLEDLPWHELDYDPIRIIVTKPVLDEIDKHKKATGRTRDRALEIFGRFRKARKEHRPEIVIQESDPRVLLERRAVCKPNVELKEQLDYRLNDERLLGIASSLADEYPQIPVIFFSHDEGPIGLAEELRLKALQIEDHWLRPRRQSDEQREIGVLKSELAKLQESEPKFELSLDGECNLRGQFVFNHSKTCALSSDNIEQLVNRLKDKHPMRTDFTPPSPEVRDDMFAGMRTERTFLAPSSDDVESYQNTRYPEWISTCTTIFENLHQTNAHRNDPFLIRFKARNIGSRPANKVRIDFIARGNVKLRRASHDNDEVEQEDGDQVEALPSIPKPPSFEVSVVRSELENSSDLAKIGRGIGGLTNDIAKLGSGLPNPELHQSWQNMLKHNRRRLGIADVMRSEIVPRLPLTPPKHDPEGFYYSQWRTHELVEKGSLTCDLWRHSSDEEIFEFEVVFGKNQNGNSAIECSIHAENLTDPISITVPVIIEVKERQVAKLALSLVDSAS